MSSEMVMAIYRPKEEVEEAEARLPSLLAEHHQVLLEEGLVTGRPPLLLRSMEDGSVLFLYEWASAQAARRAHDSPAVNAVWGRLSEVAESIALDELEEASSPFPRFEAVDEKP